MFGSIILDSVIRDVLCSSQVITERGTGILNRPFGSSPCILWFFRSDGQEILWVSRKSDFPFETAYCDNIREL